ncbi:MAG: tetratricopeptide repeat protein [Pseudomonadota bacterium]
MRVVACSLLFVALLVGTSRADEDPREAAAVHYARGMELASQGLYEAALEQFNDAYTASPHFAVLYNVGQAQIALGRPLEAIEALTKYLRDGADQVPLSRREQVQAQIGLLESRLAELSITVDRVGAIIRVDGRDVGSTPLFQPIRLAAGAHTVTAAIPNGPQLSREVPLRESERRTVELTFGRPPPAAAPAISETFNGGTPAGPLTLSATAGAPPEPWYFRGKTMRRMAYVLTGAGVLSAGAALGVYLAKRGQYDDWKTGNATLQNEMVGSAAYMAQATSNNAQARSLSTANHAIVGLSVAGGVLAAAGVTLFFVDRGHRREAGQLSFGVGDRTANLGWSWTW